MKTAIFKTSLKENEKRLPIHPEHISQIPSHVLSSLIFECNYGIEYGYEDSDLEKIGCSFLDRQNLFKVADILILPKPTHTDLTYMKRGQTLCGWNHAVQNQEISDLAIKNKLTLISWENMYENGINGKKNHLHIFKKNNEIAGYAGVIHYLQLEGLDGVYGYPKKAIILSYGSVSRGSIIALKGRGYNDITVYTKRKTHLIENKIADVKYKCFFIDNFLKDLRESDIIVNGILQDVSNPIMFTKGTENIKDNAIILDISCDEGLGFTFAKPTTFEKPIIEIERGIKYYSVDHTPSYLWRTATQEISKTLLKYIEYIINKNDWIKCPTIFDSIDILDGEIINPNIIKK